MSGSLREYGVSVYITQNVLIVPFQSDFYTNVIKLLKSEISNRILENSNLLGLVIDVSQLDIIDVDNMNDFKEILDMALLLGCRGYISGISPSVAITLAELNYPIHFLSTAIDLERALENINAERAN